MVRLCQPLPRTKPDVSGWILAGEARPELSQEGAQTAMAQLRSGPCNLDQVPWAKAGGMGEPGSTRASPALAGIGIAPLPSRHKHFGGTAQPPAVALSGPCSDMANQELHSPALPEWC